MTKIIWTAIMLTTHEIAAEDLFQPLDSRHVKVAGEIGRRIDLTIAGNLLKLNPDDHLKPFVTKNNRGAEPFIGTACQVQSDAGPVTLTEFPDPNGQRTYFRLANPKIAVPDELISGGKAAGNAVNPNPNTKEK